MPCTLQGAPPRPSMTSEEQNWGTPGDTDKHVPTCCGVNLFFPLKINEHLYQAKIYKAFVEEIK